MTDRDTYNIYNSFPRADEMALSSTEERSVSPFDISSTLDIYKSKVKDGKRAIVRLKRQDEGTHLDTIMSDLILLESHLRSEQSQILSEITSRDVTIVTQRQEIEKLRRDNRRLISRLKKITENQNRECKEGKCISRITVERDDKMQLKKAWKGPGKQFPETRSFVNQSVLTSLTSQFYEKSAFCYTDENGKIIDRVLHKPPIAEKPKVCFAKATHRPVTAVVRTLNGQCSIVSTISRLLDEESDQGINGSSGSSEPSSPESTLKPVTPRVIRLARQYEKGMSFVNGSSSSDSGRSGDDHSIKAFVMDEYEVTSGYNSDAVSDLDHDYENVLLYRETPQQVINEQRVNVCSQGDDDDNDSNYVVLRAVRDEVGDIILVDDEDQNIYANIEYGNKEDREYPAGEKSSLNDLQTNINTPNSYDQLGERLKNIPRSRHNINLVMNSKRDSRLLDNFEEFSLDALDLEDLNEEINKEKESLSDMHLKRHCGDGAETKTTTPKEKMDNLNSSGGIQGGYEKFLEVTGLSQKSILTPSRMFSNHKSVLKPRDIKHRDKLRAVFTSLSTLEEIPSPSGSEVKPLHSQSSSSQRYWRENFL